VPEYDEKGEMLKEDRELIEEFENVDTLFSKIEREITET
jgi:hypothetical protein